MAPKLMIMDPRGQSLSRHAAHMLQFRPGTDVALLNAMHARDHHRRSGTISSISRRTPRTSMR